MRDEVRRPWMRRLALGALVLMLVVVTASAWLRLTQPVAPCPAGERCEGVAVPPAGAGAVRAAHRAAASAVLLILVALLALGRGGLAAEARPVTLALLVLALGLAALGVVTPGSRAAAVMLGNLLGGLSMTALSWALTRRVCEWPAPARPLRRGAALGAALWLVQAGVGALSGTAASPWTAAGLAHLALAAVGLPLAAGVGIALIRSAHRGEGLALLSIAVLQAVLGGLALLTEGPAPVVLVHNGTAAVGLALLTGLALGGTPVHREVEAAPVSARPRAP